LVQIGEEPLNEVVRHFPVKEFMQQKIMVYHTKSFFNIDKQ